MVSRASTSFGEDPVPLNRRMGATPPEAGGAEVAAAEPFLLFAGMLLFSQPIMAVETSTRKAIMGPRRRRDILLASAKSITAKAPFLSACVGSFTLMIDRSQAS
jgi:hypothetical protein